MIVIAKHKPNSNQCHWNVIETFESDGIKFVRGTAKVILNIENPYTNLKVQNDLKNIKKKSLFQIKLRKCKNSFAPLKFEIW